MTYKLTISKKNDWIHAPVTGENNNKNVDDSTGELFRACQEAKYARLLIEERL